MQFGSRIKVDKSSLDRGTSRDHRRRHILCRMRTLNALRRQRWCWLAIAALLWCGCAAALSPDLTIKELHHTAWGPGQGAPLGGALALAQTNDGYLWVAGPSGFVRFD